MNLALPTGATAGNGRLLHSRRVRQDGSGGELTTMFLYKRTESHRRFTAYAFDQIVGSGEDTFLMVDGDLRQVLPEEIAELFTVVFRKLFQGRDVNLSILNRFAEQATDLVRHLRKVHFLCAEQGICLAQVRSRSNRILVITRAWSSAAIGA